MTTAINSLSLLRLRDVLLRVPVSRATWWAGVKSGKFPQSVKLGPRTTCWRSADIDKLIANLSPETK
ncbi:AlpA family phage regulatory protein [Diaphorobacter sp. NR2-3-3-1]|nr:AlpA family phage regulatory protein [Diaphorobacter caeni]